MSFNSPKVVFKLPLKLTSTEAKASEPIADSAYIIRVDSAKSFSRELHHFFETSLEAEKIMLHFSRSLLSSKRRKLFQARQFACILERYNAR